MINNLFSIFDSSTSINLSINWLRSILLILFIPINFWLIPSRFSFLYLNISNYIILEFKNLLKNKKNNLNLIFFISLFLIIILNNFIGLFSYIFTSSRHLTIRLTLRLVLWVSYILFGWIKNINFIFIHLVPIGTPFILMPFIVLIESIRNLIRRITLRVRLSANIIAGHLLITLISSSRNNINSLIILLILLSQRILITLELAVSIIQAYVFSILRTLYRKETNYEKILSTFSFSIN